MGDAKYAWINCAVCAKDFSNVSPQEPHFFRCVSCCDLGGGTIKPEVNKYPLHICANCHIAAGNYHPRSHCWAKVRVPADAQKFINTQHIKAWVNGISSSVIQIVEQTNVASASVHGLNAILEKTHYMPCTKCALGIYGIRYIALGSKNSYCATCYSSSDEYRTEDVWVLHGSVFLFTPPNGPLLKRPSTAIVEEAKTKANAPSQPQVGFAQNPIPTSKPGQNYSDYQAPSEGIAVSSAPSLDTQVEETSLLKKPSASAYYDDDDMTSYSEPAKPKVSVNISQPSSSIDPYSDDAPGTQSTDPYSDNYVEPTTAKKAAPAPAIIPKKAPASAVDPYAEEDGYGSSGYFGAPTTASPKKAPSGGLPSSAKKMPPPAAPKKALATAIDPYAEDSGYGEGPAYGAPKATQAKSPVAKFPPPALKKAPIPAVKKAPATAIDPYAEESGYGDGAAYGAPKPTQATPAVAKGLPSPAKKMPPTIAKKPATTVDPYAEESGYGEGPSYGSQAPAKPAVAKAPMPAKKIAPTVPKKAAVDPYADDEESGYGAGETYGQSSAPKGSAAKATTVKDPFEKVQSGSYSSGYDALQSTDQSTGGPSDGAGSGYVEPAAQSAPKPEPKKQPKVGDERDWNEEFQILMARFSTVMKAPNPNKDDVLQSCSELYALSATFITTAEAIGRVIIEEVSIPAPAKTIKPVNVGGVAGGEKYVQKGIFFKFAIDAFGVYGGDEYAQKAAGHELGGLKAYYNCHIEGLNTPFMLLMDYRGYRLIATTKLPIGSGSLIYGSADGGVTIHKDDATLNAMMQKAAEMINIKPHVVGMRGQTDVLYAPTDIEGHIGHDGRYYVLDTARICPPEPIHKSFTAIVVPPDPQLQGSFDQFRVWEGNGPMNAKTGATTPFWSPLPPLKEIGLTTDRTIDQINALLGVTNVSTNIVSSEEFGEGLLYHLKPSVASTLIGAAGSSLQSSSYGINTRASNMVKQLIYGPAILVLRGRKGAQLFNLLRYETIKCSSCPLSSDAFTPFGKHNREGHNEEVENVYYKILSESIPKFLETPKLLPHALGALKAIQSSGINTRMIGFLRSKITDKTTNGGQLKAWLLNEMIVRVTKNYLRAKLRKATSKLKPVEPIIISRFNLLLGNSGKSRSFWSMDLKAQIANKFGKTGQALTPEELRSDFDLKAGVNLLALFQGLQSCIGVVFTEAANARFQIDPARFNTEHPLADSDLSHLTVLRKSLLQPDLDQLIIKTASAKHEDPVQLLESLGKYLPDAENHAAIILQRLHIIETLLVSVDDTLGSSYLPTIMSSLHNSQAELKAKLDANPAYKEALSHLEVIRAWIKISNSCPLEIACKIYYLRGHLAIIHRDWNSAEAHLKTAYDCLTRAASVPSSKVPTHVEGYTNLDNDRPFSLLILDKLAYVYYQLGRPDEALAFSQKWVLQFSLSAFPGSLAHLKSLFGKNPPMSVALHSMFANHERRYREGPAKTMEKILLSAVENPTGLAEWCARVSLSNFNELSGLQMSPGVFQQYMEVQAFQSTLFIPKVSFENPYYSYRPVFTNDKLDQVIRMPFLLNPGIQSITVSYNLHKNRVTYCKPGRRIVLLEGVDWSELTSNSGKAYTVTDGKVVSQVPLNNLDNMTYGVATFESVNFKEGVSYTPLIIDGDNRIIGASSDRLVVPATKVLSPAQSSKMFLLHDRFANWWHHVDPFCQQDLSETALADTVRRTFDGTDSPALIYALDNSGKVWKCTDHNYTAAPYALVENNNYRKQITPPKWSLVNDFIAWKVKSIAVSSSHTLITTDNGEVHSLGSNKQGQLGHGDTVDLADPRLIRKLKGKSISAIFAGEDYSAAIDMSGTLFIWGRQFGALPEMHPFFSGKSKDSNGVVTPISKIVFQSFAEYDNSSRIQSDFYTYQPIIFISIYGTAYIWCGNTKLFPSPEFTPDPVLDPAGPIVDAAIGPQSVAYLTNEGQVYTAGVNSDGSLGNGISYVDHVPAKSAFKNSVPYAGARKVIYLDNAYIVQIKSGNDAFYALSDQGELFSWGSGLSTFPTVEPILRGIKIEHFSTSIRGLSILTNQNLTVPLPHPTVEVATSSEGTPVASKTDGRDFEVIYSDLEPSPDFALKITIPKVRLGPDYTMRVVKPGETEACASAGAEIGLYPSSQWEFDIAMLYSKGKWGMSAKPAFNLNPFGAGKWEVIIFTKPEKAKKDQIDIVFRSAPFTVKGISTADFSMTVNPQMPRPQQEMTFTFSPVPKSKVGQYLIIRSMPDGQLYSCQQIDKEKLVFKHWSAGKLKASWENTLNPNKAPITTYATLEIEVGNPESEKSAIELEFVPAGPYYKGQSIVVSWKYTRNPPPPGANFFGALYLASQKGLTAVMQGGYTALTSKEGTGSLTMPEQLETYEFRAFSIVPSVGMDLIKTVELPVTLDGPPAPSPAPVSPAVAASTSTPAIADVAATLSSLPATTEFPDWTAFFTACGIDAGTASGYSKLAALAGVPVTKVELLDGGLLMTMKIMSAYHQIQILEKVSAIKQQKLIALIHATVKNVLSESKP